MKEFTENDCIRAIKRTTGCNVVGKTIKVNKENHSAGLKTWSKIDYLVKIKPTNRVNGKQYLDKDWLGFRTFEKQFDYVKWLNS